MAKLSDEELEDALDDMERRLLLLGRGHRGLQEANDTTYALGFLSTGMYPSKVEGRIRTAARRWWSAMHEASSRYDELNRVRYKRLRERGEVNSSYHDWHPNQPYGSDFVHGNLKARS